MQLWYQQLPASLLMQTERDQIDKMLSPILGEYLLQIGGPSEFSIASPVHHKVYLAEHPYLLTQDQAGIMAELTSLPLYPGSIDVFLLVHALEFVKQPQQLLTEVFQALAPCGQLVLVGFNSLSLWGLTHLWKRKKYKPWRGHFYTIWQVKHWLRQIGFQLVSSETFYFRPPVEHINWNRHLLWVEALGQLCFPGFGSVFLISAQKREEGMTPLKIKSWESKLILNSNYIKQTTHIKHPL